MQMNRTTTALCATIGMGAILSGAAGLLVAHAQQTGKPLALLGGAINAVQADETTTPTFSHSTQITHPFLPLADFQSDVYEGKEAGKLVRVENRRKSTKKIFMIGGQRVTPVALEFREFLEGKLKEVALDFFAQDDAGTVYYLGEEVTNYRNGKVVGHEGAWEYGKGKAALGIMLPANPKVGDKYQPENVPGVTTEDDEVISTTETVSVPVGTFKNCIKVRETLSDGAIEYKVYAKGVGMIVDDSLKLVARKTRK